MTIKQLIAEVTTSFKQYEESQLIDHRSLRLWIKTALKSFGSPIMILAEKVLEIKNGETQLPEDFWSLELAVKCDMEGYNIDCGNGSTLRRSAFWKERIEQTYEWDNQSNSHKGTDYRQIIEREYVDLDTQVSFKYGNIIPLRLTRGIKREHIGNNCKNKLFIKSPFEINILGGNKLQTNFTKGFIYIQYSAIPTDEDGNIYIPDVENLTEYLQYHLKRRILEELWFNSDEQDVINKMNFLTQKEREYKALATTQLKFEALGKNWANKLKMKNIQETNRYERLFPIV